jgi:hypothetical protein
MTRRSALRMLAAALAAVLHQPAPAATQSAEDIKKKTADAWDAFKEYTHARKNDAVTHGKKLMKETDAKMKQLQGKASKASGDAKVAYEKQLEELKAKRAAAGKKLDELGKASAASWEDVKRGFADAYEDLHHAYEKAVAKFKEPDSAAPRR